MTAYEALELFQNQLAHRTGLKVALVPSPIKEAAPTVRVALRKIVAVRDTQANRTGGKKELRLTVALDGKVESATGLRLACEACETLAAFMGSVKRLEDEEGQPVPDCTVTSSANPDDGILEDPENGNVAWVRDEHSATISIPL